MSLLAALPPNICLLYPTGSLQTPHEGGIIIVPMFPVEDQEKRPRSCCCKAGRQSSVCRRPAAGPVFLPSGAFRMHSCSQQTAICYLPGALGQILILSDSSRSPWAQELCVCGRVREGAPSACQALSEVP